MRSDNAQMHHRRSLRHVGGVATIVSSWIVALLGIRVGLAWSDSRPYAPWTETCYIALAICAVLIATVGTATGVFIYFSGRK